MGPGTRKNRYPYQNIMCMVLALAFFICLHLISISENVEKSSAMSTTQPQIIEEDEYAWTDPCKFRKNHPQPVIIMSLGRSGSSITWDTMSALTGKRNIAAEITGGNPQSSKLFFDNLETDEAFRPFTNWTIQYLCHVQREGRRSDIVDAGIAGFQWKPFASSWDSTYAIEGLKSIAQTQKHIDIDDDDSENENKHWPTVKVVYLMRNPLDRKVSNLRHSNSKHVNATGKQDGDKKIISPHCPVGDTKCIEMHSKFDSNIVFPTGPELIRWLRSARNQDQRIHQSLDKLHIPFVEVTYSKLYGNHIYSDQDSAKEWMKLFRHLGVGPMKDLKMDDVRAAFSMASTHKKSRNETISNFEEVRDTLIGTDFEYLLNS